MQMILLRTFDQNVYRIGIPDIGINQFSETTSWLAYSINNEFLLSNVYSTQMRDMDNL